MRSPSLLKDIESQDIGFRNTQKFNQCRDMGRLNKGHQFFFAPITQIRVLLWEDLTDKDFRRA